MIFTPMRVREFANDLRKKMEIAIASSQYTEPLSQTNANVEIAKRYLFELKNFITHYQFKDIEEEIEFFKTIKPQFSSHVWYYSRVRQIQIFETLVSSNSDRYYKKQLKKITTFIKKHRSLYLYCLSGRRDFDQIYFTRILGNSNDADVDERFSSRKDGLVSRIHANLMLKSDILNRIEQLSSKTKTADSRLTWTCSKTDLIELIYALYSVKAIGGNTDIKQIVSTFEDVFSCSLGQYARTFLEIRLRKKNQAKFLDDLKRALMDRISSMEQ